MVFRPPSKPKKRTSQLGSFPAPVAGWIKNRSLAIPQDGPQGAELLENWFPTATGATLRRGSSLHATLPDDEDIVWSMFTYSSGGTEQLFAANSSAIYDVTVGGTPTEVLGTQTGGDWSVVQFSTAGGVFLVGVNGVDPAFLYDGTTFTAASITFPVGSTLTTADLCCVWNYKQRLYFVEKESLNVWYLPVDQVGGELDLLPLGGVMPRGGTLVFGETWSLDAGAQGGLSEQCIFVSSEGEVAVYQGLSPNDTASWSKVGLYRIGDPLGPKAWIRAGGDIIIATKIGMIPVSQAVQRDVAALSPASVSYPIEDAWNEAVSIRIGNWACALWPDGQMMVVAPAYTTEETPRCFVANARTGAWAPFTGWDARCLCVFQGGLYFGSAAGRVVQANVTGADEGVSYIGKYVPLFNDMGEPASLKIAEMARHTLRARGAVNESVSCQFDFDSYLSDSPDAAIVTGLPVWDSGTWDVSVWSSPQDKIMQMQWHSVGGTGYALAPSLQVTSGATVPLDVEIIKSDVTYQVAQIVS